VGVSAVRRSRQARPRRPATEKHGPRRSYATRPSGSSTSTSSVAVSVPSPRSMCSPATKGRSSTAKEATDDARRRPARRRAGSRSCAGSASSLARRRVAFDGSPWTRSSTRTETFGRSRSTTGSREPGSSGTSVAHSPVRESSLLGRAGGGAGLGACATPRAPGKSWAKVCGAHPAQRTGKAPLPGPFQ
jgi:hypothetical protein